MVRASLSTQNVPLILWAECVKYCAYVHNRMPRKRLNYNTPYFKRFEKHANVDCYALIVPSDRGLSRSGVTSITTVVIRDPIRIKGSLRT